LIVNIHLTCAVNTVLSLCAVIFVICIIVYVIQRIVRRYCKKKRAAKELQRGISMVPFHQNQTYSTKSNQHDYAFADRYQFPVPVQSSRFTDYPEPPPSRATLQQLLQGLAPAAPPPAAVSPPTLPAVLPPVVPLQLNHPIPA
jgi:hypothetical protein